MNSIVPALDLRPTVDDVTIAGVPSNIEAEQALLGAILYDNAAYERIPDSFKAEHFFEPFHQRLWTAMERKLKAGQLAEPILMAELLGRDPAFEELGGVRYLAVLIDRAPPAANAPDYAREVHGLALRRALITIGEDVTRTARLGDDELSPREQVEAAESALFALAETGSAASGPRAFAHYLDGAIAMAALAHSRDGGLAGLSTGLIDLNRKTGGLHPSDLIILAGRPSMGKSALGANIAFDAARQYAWEGQPDGERKTVRGGIALFFSLEMSGEQLAMRLVSEVSGVPSDRLRKGEIDALEFGRVRDAAIEIQEAPLYIDDTGGLSMAKLAARARRQKRTTGLDLVVVDYLQLVTIGAGGGKPENRVQEVSQVTQGLKALAKELRVPVIALAQLSRKVEDREDKKPQLADLRESGSIEQDADMVMFVYREAYYLSRLEPREGTPEHFTWQEQMDQVKGVADIIIGKQRHGPIGTVKLSFNEALTKFGNLARDSARYASDPAQVTFPYRDD